MAFVDIFKDHLRDLDAAPADKGNVRWLCYSSAAGDIFAALSCPVTDKWTWSCPEVTPQLISFSNVFWGVAMILICKLWYKGSPVRNRRMLSAAPAPEPDADADTDELALLRAENARLRALLAKKG